MVDDEPSVCKALQRLLRSAGFDVDTYVSGDAFLESLAAGEPDCLILDLHMPCLTGFDVQERLAAAHAGVPVVAITGHDSAETRERALTGGAAAYLIKPVSEQTLLGVLGVCLAAEASRREPNQREQGLAPGARQRKGKNGR